MAVIGTRSLGNWMAAALALVALLCAWQVSGRTLMERVVATAGSERARLAAQRVQAGLESELAAQGLKFGAPLYVRIFKQERVLELWLADTTRYRLFKTYPICTYSGTLGPKLRQGDNQAPEGFYRVSKRQLNPASNYHLSFNLGYPNAYDRAHGRTGDYLMVHGSCVSIGCYAMGDAAIEEIFTLASAALTKGQTAFDVHIFPFRFLAANDHRFNGSEWADFWSNLREGYDAFEAKGLPPKVTVSGGRYQFAW